MDWIELAHDRNTWWAFVHAVTKIWVTKNEGSVLTI
jgi:hypothetical protein